MMTPTTTAYSVSVLREFIQQLYYINVSIILLFPDGLRVISFGLENLQC